MSVVRSGYKLTDFGIIPEDWRLVPFGEFIEFQNGFNAEKRAYGRGIPFINVLEVITNSHLTQASIPGRVRVPTSQLRIFAVQDGDVLFNRTSETQEEVALAASYAGDTPVIFGGFVIRGRPDQSRLHGPFAGYGFRAPTVRGQIIARGQGAVRANVGQADLRKVVAVLPPLVEQRAIAGSLSDADGLIAALEALIAKKRNIKQGAIQELLTGERRLPEFKGEWIRTPLGKLGSFAKGRGVRRDDAHSGILPCVRYGELYTHHHDVIRTFNSYISQEVATAAFRLRCGDILFAGSGETKEEIGKCAAFVEGVEAYAGGDIIVLRPASTDPVLLGYLLNTPPVQSQKASKGQGDAVVHISAAALAGIRVKLPPTLDEQRAIAAVMSDMDAEIAALQAKLVKARAIKQGMMQVLLTGEVRLV